MLIMLAQIIKQTPAAIEKNAVAEGMSRMRGRGLEAHYSTSWICQCITELAEPCPLGRWLVHKALFLYY